MNLSTILEVQGLTKSYPNGNGTLSYDPDALKNARRMTALMVRVPCSWRDCKTTADT